MSDFPNAVIRRRGNVGALPGRGNVVAQLQGRNIRQVPAPSCCGSSVKVLFVFAVFCVTACLVYGFYLEVEKGWTGDKNFSWFSTGISAIIALGGVCFSKISFSAPAPK